jgi:hypothetical protein
VYREQAFVEHCVCAATAVGRCDQAIERELVVRERRYYRVANGVFTGVAMVTALTHVLIGFVLSIPVGFATYFALRCRARQRVIKQMGPALAASKSELLPESISATATHNDDIPLY